MNKFSLLLRIIQLIRNWPLYFMQRYSLTNAQRFTFRLRNGFQIMCRDFATDRGALLDVWLEESYDPNKFDLSFDWTSCKSVIDIGSNIGDFMVFAAAKAPHAHITCLEPEASNFKMITENIRINKLDDRVTAIEAGIAAEDKTATLYLNTESSGGHSAFQYDKTLASTTMKLRSFSNILEEIGQPCDFVKIDCEGGEYEALYSLNQSQLNVIKFLAVEYHHFSSDPTHDGPHLRTFLEQHGFTVMQPKKSIFFAYRPESLVKKAA